MRKIQEIKDVIAKVIKWGDTLLNQLEEGNITVMEAMAVVQEIPKLVDGIHSIVREDIFSDYSEFFESFKVLAVKCKDENFLLENVDNLASSIGLFVECLKAIDQEYSRRSKVCACCGNLVIYNPLPSYYSEMKIKMGNNQESRPETLNAKEYLCPICGASDRDRLIVSFLEKLQVNKTEETLLQVAPAKVIENWIQKNCDLLTYHSTDLFMDNVTFKSDIQNMDMVEDGKYDYFICSHVLEHVKDDRKAIKELYRILADDGIGIFLVPIDLNVTQTDEEWGLSEEENWKRFGQGDHCRKYAREDMIERLKEAGFTVHELGENYFGREVFNQCGLLDTSILYVLTKGNGPCV